MIAAPDAIWGHALSTLEQRRLGNVDDTPKTDAFVARQVYTFLSDVIDKSRPDVIVVHERKGTAMLRSLINSASDEQRLKWPWNRVVSSSALDQLAPETLRGKRILVFDDMMRTGLHMKTVLQGLSKHLGPQTLPQMVTVAVFAAHEESSLAEETKAFGVDLKVFYRELTAFSYRALRQSIVRILQEAGSLMLDTEHIEVRLRLLGGFASLVRALTRRAHVVVFESAARKKNITVFYEDDDAHRIPTDELPVGTITEGVVKKCRIVQRRPDEFAIIPICLPSIPPNSPWGISPAHARMLGETVTRTKEARFYGSAMIASLQPLFWTVRDIYASEEASQFEVELPSRRNETRLGDWFDLTHVQALYPSLDVDVLTDKISTLVAKAKAEGTRLRSIAARTQGTAHWVDVEVQSSNALRLLQLIGREVDERHAELFKFSNADPSFRRGLRVDEVFALGDRLGLPRAQTSALFDVLIDAADLVTRVETIREGQEDALVVRTFKPDGEVVSELVRRYSRQWGLPRAAHTR